MPIRKKKVYARFNVGTMMRELKELRERTALEHEKVLTATRDLQAKQAKGRRLQQKVINVLRFLIAIRKPIRFTTNRISLTLNSLLQLNRLRQNTDPLTDHLTDPLKNHREKIQSVVQIKFIK